ncbi:hypothetical protein E1287_42845 [Actinomadura sp. KC06]|nr:hypothetical protein E1287_42845 [Actinomadura sp. KC06]
MGSLGSCAWRRRRPWPGGSC